MPAMLCMLAAALFSVVPGLPVGLALGVTTSLRPCVGNNCPPSAAACRPEGLPMGKGRAGNAQVKGPSSSEPSRVSAWLSAMKNMRTTCNRAMKYNNGSAFLVPELKWTQTAYISPQVSGTFLQPCPRCGRVAAPPVSVVSSPHTQMHVYDRLFFDPALGNGTNGAGYTVDRWLADLNTRYGGIDKALLWPVSEQSQHCRPAMCKQLRTC